MPAREILGTKKKLSIWRHFVSTCESLGGWKGLLALFVIIALFYFAVWYTVTSGRKKRELKKRL